MLRRVHNIRSSERIRILTCIALRPEVHTKYSSIATHIQIILYAPPVTTQYKQWCYVRSSVYWETAFSPCVCVCLSVFHNNFSVMVKTSAMHICDPILENRPYGTKCCFELWAKTRDQPINYQFLDNNATKILSFAYLLLLLVCRQELPFLYAKRFTFPHSLRHWLRETE